MNLVPIWGIVSNYGEPGQVWVSTCGVPAVTAAILLIVMAGQHGLVSKILATALFVFLGEISYSIYLTHQILLGPLSQGQLGVFAVPAYLAAVLLRRRSSGFLLRGRRGKPS